MASSSLSSLDFDLQLAARAGLQSLHSFISLFSLQASSSSSSSSSLPLHLQHQQSMAASETITQFKHLGNLLSQRTGHARMRQAPRNIAATAPPRSDSLALLSSPNSPPNFPSANPNSPPINPNLHLGNPNSPQKYPNFPSSASEGFQFSQIELPAASLATASTSFEESNSGAFDDEEQSVRGSSYIDLNTYQNDNSDYYEGSINKRGFFTEAYSTEANEGRDNYPSIITYDNNDKHNNNIINDHNPSSFDLNQQAPSLDSPSLSSPQANCKYNYLLPSSTKQTRGPPLFCPQQPTMAFPPPSQESFSFDAHTQSAAPLSLVPSVSNTPYASSDDELTEFANPNQRLTVYEGQNEGSLSRQFAKILSTNPNFEAQLEKAACLIPTPTHSCITLEGSLPAYGSLPPVQKPPLGSILNHKSSSAVKRKCPSISDDSKILTKCANTPNISKCHCAKRRKLKDKSIKRVPAISDKVAEIPHDDFSWRKYGQKPIKGSPYPRGYYKCSGVKGCPAKKHVERALDDPSMLIVTYEGEHIHSKPI